jgi:hypothetical protein
MRHGMIKTPEINYSNRGLIERYGEDFKIWVTVNYDTKNVNAKKALDLLMSLNLIYIERKEKSVKKSGLELALEDVKAGRVHSAKNTKDLMKQTAS